MAELKFEDWAHISGNLEWAYEGKVSPQHREGSLRGGQSAYLIEEGSLLIRTEKGTIQGGPGHWVLPDTADRFQRFSANARILSIRFNLDWPGGQPLFGWDVAAVWKSTKTPQFEMWSRRLQKLVARKFPGVRASLSTQPSTLADHFRVRECFSSWLSCFIQTLLHLGFLPTQLLPMDTRIRHAVQALDRLGFRAPFRNEALARGLSLSPSQLDRLFVKQFGITPRRYLENRKLEHAMTGVYTTASIKEIAFDLGFNSLPHFSGWFRRKTGLSPRRFREIQPAPGRI